MRRFHTIYYLAGAVADYIAGGLLFVWAISSVVGKENVDQTFILGIFLLSLVLMMAGGMANALWYRYLHPKNERWQINAKIVVVDFVLLLSLLVSGIVLYVTVVFLSWYIACLHACSL